MILVLLPRQPRPRPRPRTQYRTRTHPRPRPRCSPRPLLLPPRPQLDCLALDIPLTPSPLRALQRPRPASKATAAATPRCIGGALGPGGRRDEGQGGLGLRDEHIRLVVSCTDVQEDACANDAVKDPLWAVYFW